MATKVLQHWGTQERRDPGSGRLLLEVTEWMPFYSEVCGGVPGGPFHHAWPAYKPLADRMGLGSISAAMVT